MVEPSALTINNMVLSIVTTALNLGVKVEAQAVIQKRPVNDSGSQSLLNQSSGHIHSILH